MPQHNNFLWEAEIEVVSLKSSIMEEAQGFLLKSGSSTFYGFSYLLLPKIE